MTPREARNSALRRENLPAELPGCLRGDRIVRFGRASRM
jgi:hypothetical protein